MRDYRQLACVDVAKSTQESEPGRGGAQLPVLQQSQLQSIAGILPVGGEFAGHQVNGARALAGGQPNALPEEKQKDIAVAGEHRSKCFSLTFVWSEPFQFFGGAAPAVVEQDGGERP